MKRTFLMVTEFILFCGLIYFAYVNYQAKTIAGFSIGIEGYENLVFSTFFVLIGAYFTGVLSGIAGAFANDCKYKDRLAAFEKRTEKLYQENEMNFDDNTALRRKIASLEIALEKALNDKK